MSNKYEQLYATTAKRNPHVSWVDTALLPLAADLEGHLGVNVRVSGPFGLRADCMLVADERYIMMITANFTEDGGVQLFYDTGETTSRFAPGTLGELNGMNNVQARLPSTIQEIASLLKDTAERK